MINVGLVGFGGIAKVHLDNYLLLDNAQVKGVVVNSELSKLKAQTNGLKTFSSIEELVENEEIDVIDVLTPSFMHKEHVLKALSLNKNVIVEKPIALNKSDALEMFNFAKNKNLKLLVAQVVRFSYESEILKDICANNKLGKVLDAYFERLSSAPKWSTNSWFLDKEKSGHIPFDLHIHDLDLIISIFGNPLSYDVMTCGRNDLSFKEQYRINYHFEGFDILATASWYNSFYPFKANWRVVFEDGILEYYNQELILFKPNMEPVVFQADNDRMVKTDINLPASSMFYKELKNFISCIENDEDVPVKQTEVLSTIEILENILNY